MTQLRQFADLSEANSHIRTLTDLITDAQRERDAAKQSAKTWKEKAQAAKSGNVQVEYDAAVDRELAIRKHAALCAATILSASDRKVLNGTQELSVIQIVDLFVSAIKG